MGPELLKMAENLAVVVESLRVMAGIQKSENAGGGARPKEKSETGNGMDTVKEGKKSTENARAKETPVRWKISGQSWHRNPRMGNQRKLRSYFADTEQ